MSEACRSTTEYGKAWVYWIHWALSECTQVFPIQALCACLLEYGAVPCAPTSKGNVSRGGFLLSYPAKHVALLRGCANLRGCGGSSQTCFCVRSSLVTYAMRKTSNGVRSSGGRRRSTKRAGRRSSDAGGTIHHGPRAWAVIRERVLDRDEHQCQAREAGCIGVATEVHHIIPQYAGGTDDDENLQSLCSECHARQTSRQAHERALVRKAEKKEAERRNHPGRKDRYDSL